MVGASARFQMSHRILSTGKCEIGKYSGPSMNLANTVFGFLEEEGSPGIIFRREDYDENEVEDKDEVEEREKMESAEDHKKFWENQHQLLHATLCKSSSLEKRIRNITKEAVLEKEEVCGCRRAVVAGDCRSCKMREVYGRLQIAGFDTAICNSKWRNSPHIPSGEHSFLDVVEKSSNIKKGEVRVIVELNFRAEFEMARASEEYNELVTGIPQVFVGKLERLLTVVKILCSAAKKCMKEKKMHMGPWRKQGYMQAKWLNTCERKASSRTTRSLAENLSRPPPPRPRTSMLTVGLLENFSNLHQNAVEVV